MARLVKRVHQLVAIVVNTIAARCHARCPHGAVKARSSWRRVESAHHKRRRVEFPATKQLVWHADANKGLDHTVGQHGGHAHSVDRSDRNTCSAIKGIPTICRFRRTHRHTHTDLAQWPAAPQHVGVPWHLENRDAVWQLPDRHQLAGALRAAPQARCRKALIRM